MNFWEKNFKYFSRKGAKALRKRKGTFCSDGMAALLGRWYLQECSLKVTGVSVRSVVFSVLERR